MGADFRNEPEPHVDRFKDNTAGRGAEYNFEELEGFRPTTVGAENASGGWLRTTAPEGAPLTSLHQLGTSGSRGLEGEPVNDTPRKSPNPNAYASEGGDGT